MQILIKTIEHKDQNYPTVGDYTYLENGDIEIRVSNMNNWKYEVLVGIHELVECLLCKDRGIKDEDIVAFDKKFEDMREKFPEIVGEEEPGNHIKAPYQKEHVIASQYELGLARELQVSWEEYDKTVNELSA